MKKYPRAPELSMKTYKEYAILNIIMDIKNAEKLVKNVISIENKKTNITLEYDKIECIKHSSIYSNTKNSIYKLKINDKIISRNNPYNVKYFCITCDRIITSSLSNLARKMNENKTECRSCKEYNQEKRSKQSSFMTEYYKNGCVKKNTLKTVLSTSDIIEISNKEFNNMKSTFVKSYFKKHLKKEEFQTLKSKILSFQNNKFNDISKFEYYSHIKCYNQTQFNPMLYDKENDKFEKPDYIKFKCDICNSQFINRDLYIRKNKYKTLCQTCSFCNYSFKIRKSTNVLNDKISYQSKLELNFINFCNENNILVKDGPKLNYIWNNKKCKYIVDFYLPKLKLLVELKGNHIWHRKQVENGKWDAKINIVNEKIKNGIYKEYMVIFTNEFENKTKIILNKI